MFYSNFLSCTLALRSSIFAQMLKKMVFNALRHIQNFKTISNVARIKRPRKTSIEIDRRITTIFRRDPKSVLLTF